MSEIKRKCEHGEYGAKGWAFHAAWAHKAGKRGGGRKAQAGTSEQGRHECAKAHPKFGHIRWAIRAGKIAAENADGATRGPASPRVGKRAAKRGARANALASVTPTPTHAARPARVKVTSGLVRPESVTVAAKRAPVAVPNVPTYSLAQVSADVLALTAALGGYAHTTEARFSAIEDKLETLVAREYARVA